ncbi:MAG: glycoside hydrolase family 88 protein [Sphaerochaeta sp.]|jgi:unsaturated rhamnogalacturonyl hydrolase|nr:glycoside hydrolase family 88 protein [Sphaerochaeta sp.]MCI2097753.1 glycoside hydrolase family 88 protein [Sphaerochaeta sp.]
MHEPLSLQMARHVQEIYRPGMMKWHYEHGLVIMASLAADPALFSWAYQLYDPMIAQDGTIATYREGEFNLDQINAGRNLFTFYEKTGEQRFIAASRILRDQLAHQPRTKSGVFWHKEIYPWQIWLDGQYMEGPFYAQYSQFTNDTQGMDDVVTQLVTTFHTLRDPKTGLLYHAYDESRGMRWSDPKTGLSPHFWGRAMGWYGMAVLDVLDYLPKDHPGRSALGDIIRSYISAIRKVQDPESGMWYQVLDQGKREGNYLETSATSMFVTILLKARRLGITTDPTDKDAALKAFNGMKQRYLANDLRLGGICSVAGLGGNPCRDGSFSYYISEPIATDDFKGVGPFILACLEVERA